MRTRNVLAVVVCASSLLAACSAADPAPESTGASADELDMIDSTMHVHWQKGIQARATSSGNLIDHGGPVLPASNVYAIWWGNPSAFPTDAQSGIDSLFQGLTGSSFLGIGTQYMRGAKSTSVAFVGNLSDSSNPPSHGIKSSTVINEACRAINANGLTADSSAIYFVFTSNFPGHTSYCAFHTWGTCNGVEIQAAYMPNTTGIAGCDPGNDGCNTYSQGTRSLANVTSHEFMEAITDADGSAWYDASGSEIGDKCAWQFQSCVSLANKTSWQLQEEWSDASNGCVQQ